MVEFLLSSNLLTASKKLPLENKVQNFVRRVGFEPTKPEGDRFTVCCDRPLHHRRISTRKVYTVLLYFSIRPFLRLDYHNVTINEYRYFKLI